MPQKYKNYLYPALNFHYKHNTHCNEPNSAHNSNNFYIVYCSNNFDCTKYLPLSLRVLLVF